MHVLLLCESALTDGLPAQVTPEGLVKYSTCFDSMRVKAKTTRKSNAQTESIYSKLGELEFIFRFIDRDQYVFLHERVSDVAHLSVTAQLWGHHEGGAEARV